MIGIYMYENKIDHKKYIGQSTNIERRKNEHKNKPSKYSRFDSELRFIGEDGFVFSVLEECTIEQLDEREKYWIHYYDSIQNGYNLIDGGATFRGESNPAHKLTEDMVNEIVILLEECKLNNSEIAKLYNVHHNTIDLINRCENWTHLHNYKSNIRRENLKLLKFPHNTFEGENNPTCKITEPMAQSIIYDIIHSNESLAAIGRKYNVKDSLVYDINRCKTWKYLHNFNKNIRKESKLEK